MDNIFHYIDKNLYSPSTVRAIFSLELVCGFVRLVSGYVDTDRREFVYSKCRKRLKVLFQKLPSWLNAN